MDELLVVSLCMDDPEGLAVAVALQKYFPESSEDTDSNLSVSPFCRKNASFSFTHSMVWGGG